MNEGMAKRPDLNELDVPDWTELALDEIEWRKLLQTAAHRPLETASRDGDKKRETSNGKRR
jgi:hypothetical protein